MSQSSSNHPSGGSHPPYGGTPSQRQYPSSNVRQEYTEGRSGVGVAHGTQPLPQPRRPNLPANVKLPPSLNTQEYRPQVPPRTAPQAPNVFQAPNNYAGYSNAQPVNVGGAGDQSLGGQAVPVTEIIREWEQTTNENEQLKSALIENNEVLERKIKDFEALVQRNNDLAAKNASLETELESNKGSTVSNKVLQEQISSSTNRFFEARVAVLGFKCRVMQLQGELDDARANRMAAPLPPPQQGSLQDVNSQVAALMRDKRDLENENKSLELVIAEERKNQDSLKDKKRIAEEEKQRLQAKVDSLQQENIVMQEQLSQTQNTSYQEHSARTHLTQELQAAQASNAHLQSLVQEKEHRDTALHSEIMALKSREKELAEKVHELERQKNAMTSKLMDVSASSEKQGASQSSPQPPVPKPRTNIQSLQIGPQLERLEEEKKGLRQELDKEKSHRQTVQVSYQRQTTEFQQLTSKHNELQKESASLKAAVEQLQSEIDSLKLQQGIGSQEDGELQQLREQLSSLQQSESKLQRDLQQKEGLLEMFTNEKYELQSKVASVEKQKQLEVAAAQREKLGEITALKRDKIERDQTISTLEEKLKNPQLQAAEMKSSAAPGGKQGAGAKLHIKLNDALGKVKRLEMDNACMETDFQEERGKWEIEKRSWQSEIDSKREELERLQSQNGQRLRKTEEDIEFLRSEVKRLETHEAKLVEEKLSLQEKLDRNRQDLSLKDNNHRQLTQQLSLTQEQCQTLTQEVESIHGQLAQAQSQLDDEKRDKTKKSGKLDNLQKEYSDVKKSLTQVQARLSRIEEEKQNLTSNVGQLTTSNHELISMKQQLETEKRTLETSCSEYDKETTSLIQDYEMCAQRLRAAEAERDRFKNQYEKSLSELQQRTERISLVESQRTKIQERLNHMDAQLKLFQEDFERERQAREAAVKVKNLAEERMAKMDKEVKDLRDRFNKQAVNRLSEDQYDEQSVPSQASASSTSYMSPPVTNQRPPSAGSGPHTLATPASHSGRSGEQGYPGQQGFGRHSQEHQRVQTPPQQQQNQYSGGPQNRPMGPQGHSTPPHVNKRPSPNNSGAHQPEQPGLVQEGDAPPVPPRERNPHQGSNDQAWTQQVQPHPQGQWPQTRVRPMTTAQEAGTAGGGILGRMPGGGFQQPHHMQQPAGGQGMTQQGRSNPQQQGQQHRQPNLSLAPQRRISDSGRNDLSMPRNNLDMTGPPVDQQHPPQTISGGGGFRQPLEPQKVDLGTGNIWVGPGEVMNQAPPSMACPICGMQNFQTQTDLEVHCAQCT